MGGPYSIFNQKWPQWNEDALVRDEVEIVVSSTARSEKIMLPSGLDKAQMEEHAMQNEKVVKLLEGRTVVKVIAVPGRLVNIVVK